MTDDESPPRRPRRAAKPADKAATPNAAAGPRKPRTASPKPAAPKSGPSKSGTAKPAEPGTAAGKAAARKAGNDRAKTGNTAGKASAARASAAADRAGPKGFGGWLWLLAIGQLLVTARMIDTLMKMTATIGTDLWQDHPGLVVADLALYGAALALQFAVIIAMVLGRRLFVPLFIASIAAYFLIGRIEPLLAIAVLGMDPAGLVSRPALVSMLIELAVGLVWGAYVLRSRRVRNTFVR